MNPRPKSELARPSKTASYGQLAKNIGELILQARRETARAVNAILTVTYWEIGRRIVEFEQQGKRRAEYGASLLDRLHIDLTERYGRGFSRQNLQSMRQFYICFPPDLICQTLSGESSSGVTTPAICQTVSGKFSDPKNRPRSANTVCCIEAKNLADRFHLPWSHYVR